MPQWRAAQLDTPVRWADDDPLEDLLNRSLLLDAELADAPVAATYVEAVDIAALARDERRLRAVFALLVNAHYQTRPSDLRQLLDNPDVALWVARAGDVVSGVLLGVAEGGMDAAMAAAVIAGERRPRGHLLPQSLAVHAGIGDCLTRRVLRVQRIAVHPHCRRQGIGLRLLDAAAAHATAHGFDLLGCAFGVERPLLGFWRRAGFRPARLGLRVDPASATRSLFMLRAATAAGAAIADAAAARFRHDLPWAVGGPLRTVDSRVVVDLMTGPVDDALRPDAAERAALAAVAAGTRQPETASAALWKAVVQLAADGDAAASAAPLVAWLLQHRPPEQVCAGFGLSGRAALHDVLRRALVSAGFSAPRGG